jgi:hypothetical protein
VAFRHVAAILREPSAEIHSLWGVLQTQRVDEGDRIGIALDELRGCGLMGMTRHIGDDPQVQLARAALQAVPATIHDACGATSASPFFTAARKERPERGTLAN